MPPNMAYYEEAAISGAIGAEAIVSAGLENGGNLDRQSFAFHVYRNDPSDVR